GGIGAEYKFEVVALGDSEQRVWEAKVRPVDPSVRAFTESGKLMVVLGYRRGAKPGDATQISKWDPVGDEGRIQFTTKVGEKLLLKLESEDETSHYERNRGNAPHHHHHPHPHHNNRQNYHYNNSSNSNNSNNNHNLYAGNHS